MPICCTRALKNYNFLKNFWVISEIVTFGLRINILFLRTSSDYSTESFSSLAGQVKRLISIAFFVNAIKFYKTGIIFVVFLRLVSICSHFVHSSHCVTHGVRRAPVKSLLHAGVWNFRSCKWSNRLMQYNWFFNFQHTKVDFWRLKSGVIFSFKITYTVIK